MSQCLHLLADLGVDGKELAHAAARSASLYIPINAYALALVEIGLSVAWADALGAVSYTHLRAHET